MKKLFVFTIKFAPIAMMIGSLCNNFFYYFDVSGEWVYLLDFILGNSLITSLLLFVSSYTFGLCSWHRLVITANLINILIASADVIYSLPIKDLELIVLYCIVNVVFLLIIMFNKFCRNEKYSKGIS